MFKHPLNFMVIFINIYYKKIRKKSIKIWNFKFLKLLITFAPTNIF